MDDFDGLAEPLVHVSGNKIACDDEKEKGRDKGKEGKYNNQPHAESEAWDFAASFLDKPCDVAE
jgi:hypothetical protein